jgi:hypothetical protein
MENVGCPPEATTPPRLLFVEPRTAATGAPLIDDLTLGMTAMLNEATHGPCRYRGVHACPCGAQSDNKDWFLPSGHLTNSLAVHYLAHHRHDFY